LKALSEASMRAPSLRTRSRKSRVAIILVHTSTVGCFFAARAAKIVSRIDAMIACGVFCGGSREVRMLLGRSLEEGEGEGSEGAGSRGANGAWLPLYSIALVNYLPSAWSAREAASLGHGPIGTFKLRVLNLFRFLFLEFL
jgi:hypothetical protein